jgi:hypothetical protein
MDPAGIFLPNPKAEQLYDRLGFRRTGADEVNATMEEILTGHKTSVGGR